jgi:uncharacterized protein (DUF302 family)
LLSRTSAVLFAATLAAAGSSPVTAQSARVTVASQASFDRTVSQLKSAVGEGGMMIMAEVDQGNMLSMTGLRLKATLFLVGNPTVGKQIFEREHAAGLYVPLRVYVYEDAAGKAFLSYDRPTQLLGQFGNPEIDQTAAMLDQKLADLANMVTR